MLPHKTYLVIILKAVTYSHQKQFEIILEKKILLFKNYLISKSNKQYKLFNFLCNFI